MIKKFSLVVSSLVLAACMGDDTSTTPDGEVPPSSSPVSEQSPVPTPPTDPSATPSSAPTPAPTNAPIATPTSEPSPAPTNAPIATPTSEPSPAPTNAPIATPTSEPSPAPTNAPIATPTSEPSPAPTNAPIATPTSEPIPTPTNAPNPTPSIEPSPVPTPTEGPSGNFDLAQGKAHYETFCVECHGITGDGSAALPVAINNVDFEGIMARVDGGNMPTGTGPLTGAEYSPEQCVGDCAYQIAGYVSNGFPGAVAPVTEGELGFEGCSQTEVAPASRALRLLTRREYQNSINDIFSVNMELTTNFLPEGRSHGFTNNADIAQVTALHLDNYYDAATRVTTEVLAGLNSGPIREAINCSANYDCIRTFVEHFGEKLFRRPLADFEVEEYMAFFTALRPLGQDDNYFNHSDRFSEAIAVGLPALLMSPNFFYRKELGQASGEHFQLDDYEMATLIAYTFTGSTPDDSLLAAAANQQLRTKEQFKSHAERLLATSRGQDQMAHFAVEWWDAGLELIGSKNADFYQDYGSDVIQSMVGEMQAFFKYVVFESSGKFQELYEPGYTMLDGVLSQYYGVGDISGSEFTPVTTEQRGGILSFGAIMASNASTEESSPIKRGIFVREQLMCDPLPPIPRDVNIANPDLDPTKPMRERFEEHSANENCWVCHKFIDDIGYAMEIYDASGKHRDQEIMYDLDTQEIVNLFDIFTEGTVIDIDGDEEHFISDLTDLSQIMAESDSTKSCMTTQYYRYVMGYEVDSGDSCAIQNLNKIFADSAFDIPTLLIGITQLDSFSSRK